MNINQPVHAVVEGIIDDAVVRKLFAETGIQCGTIYVQNGVGNLLKKLPSYNQSAKRLPWFVVCDLDRKPCAPSLHHDMILAFLHVCIAVRAVEAWFMADRGALARYLSIPQGKIPARPEEVDDPKQTIVNLARQSRSSVVKDAVVPSERSGRPVGPGYTATMIEFVQDKWRPVRASQAAPSLARALARCRVSG
ncbi:MAG: hypothetical protein F4162_08060 [Synechococcus sp. SB0676_bin_10]|uniref:DUF4276 family protein n=1 Tax=Synechococcus sp. SB0676_bin_10 TaxID=2604869 RepID=A0A6B1F967_9SYNE|nr:hypothetical protein [Synechococcus sp. SB0676_bin_10]